MSLFRFALYFAALIACAVAAYPSWAPVDMDPDAPSAEAAAPAPSYYLAYKKAAVRYHLAAPARMASRD